jgi:hypothetical protein
MPDFRLVTCECCQGEGRHLTCDGGPYEEDHGECCVCEGTGRALVEVDPIEMEDLS